MNLNKRILSCILLMALLAAVVLIGYLRRDAAPAMGENLGDGRKNCTDL